MKRLYALLVILIIIYVGINVAATSFNVSNSDATTVDDTTNATLGNDGFPKLDNFTDNKINDTTVSYVDEDNMTINLTKIDNSQNIEEIASKEMSSGSYTSNQTIDQNGVTTYFLYDESGESYNADIFFNVNKQNYLISGSEINYDESDYFINHAKAIIDAYSSKDSSSFSRW